MSHESFLIYVAVGAAGGFLSEYLNSGCLELPKVKDKKLYLGSLGGIVIGMIAGVIGDTNPINAFVWGAGGLTILKKFLVLNTPAICKDEKEA